MSDFITIQSTSVGVWPTSYTAPISYHDMYHFKQTYPLTTMEAFYQMKNGDRVRIKEGYDSAGNVGYYVAKSNDEVGMVIVEFPSIVGEPVDNTLLADAIEPYPYTREERIERAIEDLYASNPDFNRNGADPDFVACLYAILDAGI